MERRIGQKFILHNRIGHGSFGDLYSGEHLLTQEKVAVKLEHFQTRPPQLFYESKIYKVLSGSVGIPALKWYGVEDEYNVMVIDLLERSVEDLFADCAYHFSLKTVLMIADQMIARMQYVHSKNFIHRDIKPEHILFTDEKRVVLIDLDASMRICPQKGSDTQLLGTTGYAAPEQFGFSRSDGRTDIYAIGILLNELLTGLHPSVKIYQQEPMRHIIEKSTRLNPEDRFQDVESLEKEFLMTVEIGTETGTGSKSPVKGKRKIVGGICVTLIFALVIAFSLLRQDNGDGMQDGQDNNTALLSEEENALQTHDGPAMVEGTDYFQLYKNGVETVHYNYRQGSQAAELYTENGIKIVASQPKFQRFLTIRGLI